MKKNISQKLLASAFCAVMALSFTGGPAARAASGNCTFNANGDMICDGSVSGQTSGSTALPSLQSNPTYQQQKQNSFTTDSGTIYMPSGADCGKNNNPEVKATGATMKNGVVTIKGISAYQKGMTIIVTGASPAAYNGTFTVTEADSNGFSYKISPEPSEQPSGNITVKRDTSGEQQSCIDDMQKQLDDLEKEIAELQSVLSTNGSDINQMMENMTPVQQQNFMNALQQALQQMFTNPSNGLMGTNPLTSGSNPVQQAINTALNKAGVPTNAGNDMPTSKNTPVTPSNDCKPETLTGSDGKQYMTAKDANGENMIKATELGSTDTSPLCGAGWGDAKSKVAQCIAEITPDKTPSGTTSCAAAVSSILQAMGLIPQGARTMNAEDFGTNVLKPAGWTLLVGGTVTNCPPGGVLVYWSDKKLGQPLTTSSRTGKPTGGSLYGHVEINTGPSTYTHFTTTNKPGGSLGSKNFKECWVYQKPAPVPPGYSDREKNLKQCFAKNGVQTQ
jgi:hypothetical protein